MRDKEVRTGRMAHQTESGPTGSGPAAKGPALAILAVAPRPGLVLPGLCPPFSPTEAGALQTAWLKGIVQELPGVAVHLFGGPADALPMLRYFAGPGVTLRPWQPAAPDLATLLAAAAELLAEGHAPVAVRTTDAPDAPTAAVLACLAAAAVAPVVARDQRGEPWLLAVPDAMQLAALRSGAVTGSRGPWARSVRDPDDLALLLSERSEGPADAPVLPVVDLQSALRFHEVVFGSEVLGRDPESATVRLCDARIRLHQRRSDFAPNGLRLPCADFDTRIVALREHGCIAAGDAPGPGVDGGIDTTATDQDGNRWTFVKVPRGR